MDVTELAQTVTALLAPTLPYLWKAGEAAGTEIVENMGADVWEQVKHLWPRLRPSVAAKPAAHDAVVEVVQSPNDEDARAAFRLQLRKLLAADPQLAQDVAQMLNVASSPSVTTHNQSDNQSGGNSFVGTTTVHGTVVGGNQHNRGI